MSKLKSCPFCGDKAILDEMEFSLPKRRFIWVHCKSCGAQTRQEKTEEDAIKCWNIRVDDSL